MKYSLKATKQFDRQLKKCLKRGFDDTELENVLDILVEGGDLPAKYHAHKLSSKFNRCWECHITSDWLLLWEYDHDNLILLLLQTGTHSDLF